MESQELRFALLEFVPTNSAAGGWELLNVTYVESRAEIEDELSWWADRDSRVQIEVVDLTNAGDELFEISKGVLRFTLKAAGRLAK